MPSLSHDFQSRSDRFREQRWLIDAVIKTVGIEFDQNRLHYLSSCLSPDHRALVLGLQSQVKRLDDMAPQFAAVARRFEIHALQAQKAGHVISASDGFFAASVMYGGAQWPIFKNTKLNDALERKKNECFARYMEGADHRIKAVEIPYQGRSLPAYLHLPPGYTSGKLPCVVMIEGMDTFKEMALFGAGDRFLRRGLACLVIDGPGQGSALLREIWYDPDTYGEVGTAAVDYLLTCEEIDRQRIMAWGLSFGSYWATQIAAAEPRFLACAVMYTSFAPGNWPYFEMASPAFMPRFMYMTGTDTDEAFNAVAGKIDVRKLSSKLSMPYFVMAGEDDSLSDISIAFEHLNNVLAPKSFVLFAGEEHGIFGARSSQLSSPHFTIIADWLADRAAGKTIESTYTLIDRNGQPHTQPWGEKRFYEYGAPLGVEQLFSEQLPIGLS